jgi:hypothetical protein
MSKRIHTTGWTAISFKQRHRHQATTTAATAKATLTTTTSSSSYRSNKLQQLPQKQPQSINVFK